MSKKKTITSLIVIGSVVVFTIAVLLITQTVGGCKDTLPKFVNYFDRPGIVHIVYKSGKGDRQEEWVDYQNRRAKELTQENSKTTWLLVYGPKELRGLNPSIHTIETERAGKENLHRLIAAVDAVKKKQLKKRTCSGSVALYGFKEAKSDKSKNTPIYQEDKIGLSKETGHPIKIISIDNDGETTEAKVSHLNRLPESKGKEIFNTREIKPEQLKGSNSVDFGLSRKKLRGYKPVKVYWLGGEVDGVKVSSMGATRFKDGIVVGINYGVGERSLFRVNQENAKNPGANESLKISIQHNKRKRLGKHTYYYQTLQENPQVYLKVGPTYLWFDTTAYSSNQVDKFIALIDKNLERP